MKSILALVLVGVAIIHLGGATEEETDTQVAQQENQLGLLQIQELAEAGRRSTKRKDKKGKAGKQRKGTKKGKHNPGKGKKGNRKGKGGKGKRRKGKGGKGGKGKRRKGQGGKRRKRIERKKKSKKAKKKSKKAQRRQRKQKKRKIRNNKAKKARQGNSTGGASAGGCETGCSTLMVSMMKAARKQNTYLKQFNRLVNGQKQAKKKGLKKSDFGSNATDGPLALLVEAGGGDKADMSCAGSKTNQASKLMANLTTKLAGCEAGIAAACNDSKMTTIKASWTKCNTSMVNFKTASDDCLKKGGVAACACFNASATVKLVAEVEACSGEEMLKASGDDKKLLKTCKDAYGECRRGGESIRPVLSACQAGGRTEEETKKDVGVVLKNEEANNALQTKLADLKKQAGRKSMKRREVTFNGATYALTTCGEWATAGTAWVKALDSDQIADISAAGTTIAGTTVTCSAEDLTALTALETASKAVSKKIKKKKEMLQKKLEKLTGSTISPADAAAAATPPAGGSAGGAATKAGRRRNKILAEFRQRF